MNSNTISITKYTFSLLVVASLLVTPFFSHAQESDRNVRFCTNLDTIEERLFSRLSERTDGARDKHQNQVDRYQTVKSDRLEQLSDTRAERDVAWEVRIAELRERAETDAQDDAIDTFVSTTEDLVETRRAAVDAAVDVFEAAAEELKDERTEVFNSIVDTYQADIETAFDTAETACEDGDDPSDARADLRTDLEAVREAFRTERESYDFRSEFQALQDTRRTATTEAKETFLTGFAAAKATLKAAFNG